MILYCNTLVPKGFAGVTLGPVIIIRPAYKDDQGLLAHEQVHVEQWKRRKITHSFLYLTNHNYRLECEVEGYRVQIEVTLEQHPERSRNALVYQFAWFIANKYRLRISQPEAIKLLQEEA